MPTATPTPTTVQPTTDAGGRRRRIGVAPADRALGRAAAARPRRAARARRGATTTTAHHRHRHRHLVGPGVFGVLLIWTGLAWLTGVGLDDRAGRRSGDPRPGLRARVLRRRLAWLDLPGPRGRPRCSRSPRSSTSPSPVRSASSTGRPTRARELQDDLRGEHGRGHPRPERARHRCAADDACEPRSASATSSCSCSRTRTLSVNTEVGAGETVVFGEKQNGVGFETHDRYPGEGGTLDPRPRGGDGPDRGAPRARPTWVDDAHGAPPPRPSLG